MKAFFTSYRFWAILLGTIILLGAYVFSHSNRSESIEGEGEQPAAEVVQ
jgi:hypothetical protein